MNIPVRTKKKTEINNRRKLVAQYTLNRLDQTEIAEKLGVTQGTISNDLKALNKQWLEAAQDDISQIKARELAELDFMELDAAITIQKLKKDGDYSKALRYAGHRLDIKKRRADMLGLDDPKKVELDAKHDIHDPSKMTDDELQKAIDEDARKLIEAGLIPDSTKV